MVIAILNRRKRKEMTNQKGVKNDRLMDAHF